MTDTWRYQAFGETRARTGSGANPFGFVGELGYYQEAELGLHYVRARWYDARTGRWVSEDPVEGGNLYGYVGNWATSGVDPSGRKTRYGKWGWVEVKRQSYATNRGAYYDEHGNACFVGDVWTMVTERYQRDVWQYGCFYWRHWTEGRGERERLLPGPVRKKVCGPASCMKTFQMFAAGETQAGDYELECMSCCEAMYPKILSIARKNCKENCGTGGFPQPDTGLVPFG